MWEIRKAYNRTLLSIAIFVTSKMWTTLPYMRDDAIAVLKETRDFYK